MDVQEMSLFELALEAVKAYQRSGEPSFNLSDFYTLLDELGKQMAAEEMPQGSYRWGNHFVMYRKDKMGSPTIDIYEHKTASLMSLPGWSEYKARKGVDAAELLEG